MLEWWWWWVKEEEWGGGLVPNLFITQHVDNAVFSIQYPRQLLGVGWQKECPLRSLGYERKDGKNTFCSQLVKQYPQSLPEYHHPN